MDREPDGAGDEPMTGTLEREVEAEPLHGGSVRRRFRIPVPGALAFLLLIAVIFTVLAPGFIGVSNLRAILFTAAILVIASLGQVAVVLTRQLDLSVGAVMAASSYFSIALVNGNQALGWLVPVLAVGFGALLGAANGFVVATLRIPSIVATLGMLSIIRGLITSFQGGRELTGSLIPAWLLSFLSWSPLGVPALVVLALLIALATGGMLSYTRFGRNLFAVGSSASASAFYGLSVKRTTFGAYVFSGVLASIAGILLAGQVGNVTPDVATGWELQTLAAVVIGGGSFLGGVGTAKGAVIGAIVIAAVNNGLIYIGISGYFQGLVQGAAIVAAVAFDILVIRRATHRVARPAVAR